MGKSEGIRIFLRIRPFAKGSQRLINNGAGRNGSNNNNISGSNNNNSGGGCDASMSSFAVEHTFDNSTVHFHLDRRSEGDVINNTQEDYRFTFRRAFEPNATQEEVFNVVAKDCVMSVLDGYNSTIFAYGQTGSGKTYSITGGAESYEDRGIIPRAIAFIYDELARRQRECTWTVAVSYLQIYNDKGQDLLNHGRDARRLEDLPVVTIHDGDDDEMMLRGLAQHGAPNAQEALNLLFLGDTNRLYCETPMNKTSSRSHCVFTIYIEARAHGSSVVRRSKLNLVDLAGSERVAKTGVSGNVLTEAKHINLSLHYLEQVIMALSEQASGRREHVPFRNSFMTMVLRDSLGGNCRTSMLATAHPAPDHLPETISTCRFAQRVALIRQDAHVNEEVDAKVLVRKLKAELQQLRDQLAFYTKDGGAAPDRELSDDEKQRCREMVQRFVEDTEGDVRIEGFDGDFARIYYCFDVMKQMLSGRSYSSNNNNNNNNDADAGQQLIHPSLDTYRSRIDALEMSLQQKENEMNMLFGVLQKTQRPRFNAETQTGDSADAPYGSSISRIIPKTLEGMNKAAAAAATTLNSCTGAVPFAASSLLALEQNSLQEALEKKNGSHHATLSALSTGGCETHGISSRLLHERLNPAQATAVDEFFRKQEQLNEVYDLSALTDAELLKDRATAFEAFNRSYRNFAQTESNKRELKGRYETCKATARQLNDTVDNIKRLKAHIQRLRAERALQGVEEVDDAEKAALEDLTRQKAVYNDLATSLRRQKEEIDAMHLFMKRSQEQLTKDFEDWLQIRQKQLAMATGSSAVNNRVSNRNISGTSNNGTTSTSNNNNTDSGGYSTRSTAVPTFSTSSETLPNVLRLHPFQNSLAAQPSSLAQQQQQQQQQQRQQEQTTESCFSISSSTAAAELPPLRDEKTAFSRLRGVNNGSNNYYNSVNNNGVLTAGDYVNKRSLGNAMSLCSAGVTGSSSMMNVTNAHVEEMPQHPATAPPIFGQECTANSSSLSCRSHLSLAQPNYMTVQRHIGNKWVDGDDPAPTLALPPTNHFGSEVNAPNPYAPEHRSTGDTAADKQLAALYKARDALRKQLQQ